MMDPWEIATWVLVGIILLCLVCYVVYTLTNSSLKNQEQEYREIEDALNNPGPVKIVFR